MSGPDHVYLVYTPYQTIQALLVAAGASGRHHLLAVPDVPVQRRILGLLAARADNPFQTINIVEPSHPIPGPPPAIARRLGAARNVRRIRRLVAGLPDPISAYTANTQTVEGQALVAAAVSRSDSSSAFALEDGLLTYEKRAVDLAGSSSTWSSWLRRLYLGRSAQIPAGQAPLASLAGIYATFPGALPPGVWADVPVLQVPPADSVRAILADLARSLISESDHEACQSLDALVVVPHSRMVSEGVRVKDLSELLRRLVDGGLATGLKYHPRESWFYLSHQSEVHELSPDVPVEFLFALAGANLNWIVTDRTTAAVSGPQFCPSAQTVIVAVDPSVALLEAYRRLSTCSGAMLAASPAEILTLVDGDDRAPPAT